MVATRPVSAWQAPLVEVPDTLTERCIRGTSAVLQEAAADTQPGGSSAAQPVRLSASLWLACGRRVPLQGLQMRVIGQEQQLLGRQTQPGSLSDHRPMRSAGCPLISMTAPAEDAVEAAEGHMVLRQVAVLQACVSGQRHVRARSGVIVGQPSASTAALSASRSEPAAWQQRLRQRTRLLHITDLQQVAGACCEACRHAAGNSWADPAWG